MERRDFIKIAVGYPFVSNLAWAAMLQESGMSAGPMVKPTWLGFGLNQPATHGSERFPLTMAMMEMRRQGKRSSFQAELNEAIVPQLKSLGDIVAFKDSNEFGEGSMLAAVLDYENVLEARLGSSSFVVLHLVGHGALLDFDRGRGWIMRSSFPFPVTLLRESRGGKAEVEARQYLAEAYTDPRNSFATSFAKTVMRLSPRWKDTDAGRGFNIRVMTSTIHPEAQAKLQAWGVAKNINRIWLGHLASAAICEGLDVPVVPFAETQALGNYTYSFSERLVAQNVRLPEETDIDLRFHVTLRNIAREVKYRAQFGRWEVTRMVVIDVRALDDRGEEIVILRLGYMDDQPDALAQEADNSAARDAHFFDMAIYRGLQTLFSAIDNDDKVQLARVFVKPDARQQSGLDVLRSKYRKAFDKRA